MRQFMVRIMRDTDEEYADVVVDAADVKEAELTALLVVADNPRDYFDVPPPPKYYVDPSSDVDDVTGGEYASAIRTGAKHV